MNKVCLVGRLSIDPITRYNQDNLAITRFSLAVKRPYNKDLTDFINCVAFGKSAEFIDKYFVKGQMIAVSGSMQVNKYEDKNGTTQYATNVVVAETYFTGNKVFTNNAGNAIAEQQNESQDFVPVEPVENDEDLPF